MQNLQNLQHKQLFVIEADYTSQKPRRIAKMKVLYYDGRNFKPVIQTRLQVVSLINNSGFEVYTATLDSKNKLQHGAEVIAYPIDKEWFLKTIPNDTPEDNLGELPSIS